ALGAICNRAAVSRICCLCPVLLQQYCLPAYPLDLSPAPAPETYTLSLHDALPISAAAWPVWRPPTVPTPWWRWVGTDLCTRPSKGWWTPVYRSGWSPPEPATTSPVLSGAHADRPGPWPKPSWRAVPVRPTPSVCGWPTEPNATF